MRPAFRRQPVDRVGKGIAARGDELRAMVEWAKFRAPRRKPAGRYRRISPGS
jgi:hypothetical protein